MIAAMLSHDIRCRRSTATAAMAPAASVQSKPLQSSGAERIVTQIIAASSSAKIRPPASHPPDGLEMAFRGGSHDRVDEWRHVAQAARQHEQQAADQDQQQDRQHEDTATLR